MFELAANDKIGQYLALRIDERFKSRREFCRKYLEIRYKETNDDQIRKMSNRLSSILKGKKEIQLYDFPLFCRLLEVSCEDILTAGKSHAPASARLTNYAAAFSKDKRDWESHVNREDSPILNADEFGKTFIDYALEAENYDLLKYLMDKQYIWFVGADKKNRFTGFGAGTSIEKATFPSPMNWNVLDIQLKMRDELRTQMIALAIRHKDMEMLEQLHAREIPTLYQMSFNLLTIDNCKKYNCKQCYNAKLMEELIHADNKILEYFSGEFEIVDIDGITNRFIFPFMGELIERLLQNKNDFAEYMLKDAIQHNQYVYDRLKVLLTDTVKFQVKLYHSMINSEKKNNLEKTILRDLYFYDDGSLVYYYALFLGTKKGLRSNIIQVNAESEDTMINRRISELNDLYNAIHNITPNFEGIANNADF